jgi:crossover junction endodeoxyribonuclease RuvC
MIRPRTPTGHELIVGVDPGATGAIAALNLDGQLAWTIDMPHTSGTVQPALIAHQLTNQLVVEAWVEHVHAMPRQGVASSFKFGMAYGTVLGVLGTMRIPVRHVTPAKWKKAAGLPANKTAARQRACELWPDHAHLFARVKDDGRAEAALIALHGLTQQHDRSS